MFHVKIEQDEDGIYIATVPALPGCVSDGVTEAEARENIKEAMELWLEAEDARAVAELPPSEQNNMVIFRPVWTPGKAA